MITIDEFTWSFICKRLLLQKWTCNLQVMGECKYTCKWSLWKLKSPNYKSSPAKNVTVDPSLSKVPVPVNSFTGNFQVRMIFHPLLINYNTNCIASMLSSLWKGVLLEKWKTTQNHLEKTCRWSEYLSKLKWAGHVNTPNMQKMIYGRT